MINLDFKKTFLKILKLCLLGTLAGILGGLVGACFAHMLSFVTELRQNAPWLVLLLPVGSIAIVLLYRLFRVHNHRGTNEIIQCLASEKPIRSIAAPLIFVCSGITHLLGGSAGREGAALQLGGAGAAALCDTLRLKDEDRTVTIMSGMSAVFAALFGTPLTASVFILEFKARPKLRGAAILPCLLASIVAAKLSSVLLVAKETATLSSISPLTFATVARLVALSLGLAILAWLMCYVFHNAGRLTKQLISNEILRTVLASLLLVILTIVVGDMRYNGSGMSMAIHAIEGHTDWFDFLLKLLFTTITLVAGLKGGEIVPTFCIGATFGCFAGGILGLDPGFAAALGLIGLFCCATKSPMSAFFLGLELFGHSALLYYVLICLILWPLSVKNGLFENR